MSYHSCRLRTSFRPDIWTSDMRLLFIKYIALTNEKASWLYVKRRFLNLSQNNFIEILRSNK